MKVTALPNDELVKFYIELRDRRAARKKTYVTEDDADKVKQEYIEGVLLQRYNAAGIESARTMYGTAFKSKLTTASVGDKDVFMNHVKQNSAFELLEVRCSKEAVQQYIDEHKELPPGVNWREEIHIRVQRS